MQKSEIKIISYPGTHGNFLMFMLNHCLLGHDFPVSNPFDTLGTSHNAMWAIDWKTLDHPTHFQCYHHFNADILPEDNFIKIDFDISDDMFVMQLVMKRGNSGNVDVDNLCTNTYHTLLNHSSPEVRAIVDHINRYTDISPYFNIKDSTWPDIQSVDDFYQLPQDIIDECKNVFGFVPVELTPQRPDAPRWVLRHLFKSWFESRDRWSPYGAMKQFDDFPGAYRFNLRDFYSFTRIKHHLAEINKWFALDMDTSLFTQTLHQQFVSQIPFRNTLDDCHRILQAVAMEEDVPINLNVFCEGYLNHLLEEKFQMKMPLHRERYFGSTGQIIDEIAGGRSNR